MCSIPNYDLYYIHDENPIIWLSGGIHGDEPAGTYAAFLVYKILRARNIPCIVFPCMNPWGFDRNKREGMNGMDLNHVYELVGGKSPKCIESQKQFTHVSETVKLVLDLHEDMNANGCYLWKSPQIGEKEIKEILDVASKIDDRKIIEGYKSNDGIINDTGRSDEPPSETVWLNSKGFRNTLVLETNSSNRDMKDRIRDLRSMALKAIDILVE
jgi:predicted deacylase